MLHVDYLMYYTIDKFKKECRTLLLCLKRMEVSKDISMYICRHLSNLHDIFPHPSLHYQIKYVIFKYIDRGVGNYKRFVMFLHKFIPNIELLNISQKFSRPYTDNLCYFINKFTNLRRLCILDTDGDSWIIDWNHVLKCMPSNSIYIFMLEYEEFQYTDKK